MVHDYWMHRDDPAFVRSLLPGVRGVLAWYEATSTDRAPRPHAVVELRGLGERVAGRHTPRSEDGHSAMVTSNT